jgi:hypothetical protein
MVGVRMVGVWPLVTFDRSLYRPGYNLLSVEQRISLVALV